MKYRFWSKGMIFLILSAILISACGTKKDIEPSNQNANEPAAAKQWSEAPEMAIDPNKQYNAVIHTSKGDFTIELFAKESPTTVNNFVFLAKQKFYDGITFHRIIQTFMIQTGDPLGNGTGGPGYTIQDELGSPYQYEPGIVAMAKTPAPNSGGSQFFICTGDNSEVLNQSPVYPIFGKVVDGMDVVQAIAAVPVKQGNEPTPSVPTETVTIDSITINEQ